MTKHYCDICECEVENPIVLDLNFHYKITLFPSMTSTNTYDVCADCRSKLEKIFEKKAKVILLEEEKKEN